MPETEDKATRYASHHPMDPRTPPPLVRFTLHHIGHASVLSLTIHPISSLFISFHFTLSCISLIRSSSTHHPSSDPPISYMSTANDNVSSFAPTLPSANQKRIINGTRMLPACGRLECGSTLLTREG